MNIFIADISEQEKEDSNYDLMAVKLEEDAINLLENENFKKAKEFFEKQCKILEKISLHYIEYQYAL